MVAKSQFKFFDQLIMYGYIGVYIYRCMTWVHSFQSHSALKLEKSTNKWQVPYHHHQISFYHYLSSLYHYFDSLWIIRLWHKESHANTVVIQEELKSNQDYFHHSNWNYILRYKWKVQKKLIGGIIRSDTLWLFSQIYDTGGWENSQYLERESVPHFWGFSFIKLPIFISIVDTYSVIGIFVTSSTAFATETNPSP